MQLIEGAPPKRGSNVDPTDARYDKMLEVAQSKFPQIGGFYYYVKESGDRCLVDSNNTLAAALKAMKDEQPREFVIHYQRGEQPERSEWSSF